MGSILEVECGVHARRPFALKTDLLVLEEVRRIDALFKRRYRRSNYAVERRVRFGLF